MPGFSQDTLEQIRAASDIVDIIGAYLPLKRAGANFVALCPFHHEKTPSFNVNPHRQIFYCFGCHKGGDVFAFVREHEHLDFPEVVRRLAERARIPLEYDQDPSHQQTRHLKEKLLDLHEQVTQRWQNTLANEAAGQVARDYLVKRAVSPEAVKLFRLGAAADAWDDTVNWARSKGYETDLVEKAGLIIRKEGTDRYYDRFRGRLMFPICDDQGRVVGFSGRILSGDEKTAKYVNSPETPIFTKSKVFFGLDKSKRAVLEANSAIVCEGQLDLIACFMAGVQNIVAPQGTAFTADHARIIKRFASEVVLCFDSDAAGQNAAVRSLDHLLASGLAVRVARVPEPHDPDSFIKAMGGDAFRALIDRAEGFFDYYLNRLCAINDVTTDRGRLRVLGAMAEAVHKTSNSVIIDTYAQKAAFRLKVREDAVRAQFKRFAQGQRRPHDAPEEDSPAPLGSQRPSPPEYELLKLLLANDDLVPWVAANLKTEWVRHPVARQIIELRLEAHTRQTWANLPAFIAGLANPETQTLATEAATVSLLFGFEADREGLADRTPTQSIGKPQPLVNASKRLSGAVETLRNQALDRELAALKVQGDEPDTPVEQRREISRRQAELRAAKREPITPPPATGESA